LKLPRARWSNFEQVGIHFSQIDLLIGQRALLWHARMIRACERAGFATSAVAGADHGEKIVGFDLLAFERLVYRVRDCALQPTHIDVKPTIGAEPQNGMRSGCVRREVGWRFRFICRPVPPHRAGLFSWIWLGDDHLRGRNARPGKLFSKDPDQIGTAPRQEQGPRTR
jgi:hypothetical protein